MRASARAVIVGHMGTMEAMKIMVVDDERAVRESLRRALELEGYEVELAADGEEALEQIGPRRSRTR